MSDNSSLEQPIADLLGLDDGGNTARERENATRHVLSLGLSKSADGLIDPKLVLSWLLTTLGAPAWMVGLLVPIRESGALLPQLFTAGYLTSLPQRKWVWVMGAAAQGVSALCIAIAGLTLSGAAAGSAILFALAVLAISRSVCSVSYKDVLGRTVSKGRRGRVTGLAGSWSAGIVIVYVLILSSGLIGRMPLVLTGLFLAGAAWLAASAIFTGLSEDRSESEGKGDMLATALGHISLLRTDAQLRRFILTRALLTATALAPPFMVAAAADEGRKAYEGLGFLVLASSSAALLSSFVWGRLSDASSRKVLIFSALLASGALLSTLALMKIDWLAAPFALPVVLFVLMIAYQGVRLGRSTHLVDMADDESRAAYTALSNTIIGIILIFGGAFGLLASAAGVFWVLAVMAAMCVCAVFAGLGLSEVQSGASGE